VSRESCSSVPGAATRILPRTVLPPTTLLYLWSDIRRWPECALSPSSAVCGSRWRRTWRKRVHYNASVASASAIRSGTADTLLGASRVGGSHLSCDCPAPRGQPRCCSCGGNNAANYRGCVKRKEARAALAKWTTEQGRKMVRTSKPAAAPKENQGRTLC